MIVILERAMGGGFPPAIRMLSPFRPRGTTDRRRAADGGVDKAFLIDYDSSTGAFTNLTYFTDGNPASPTHFEGITGTPTGYNVIGIAGSGYAFGSITRQQSGTFGPIDWTGNLAYPGASVTTGNTVIGDQTIGIYQLSGTSAVYAYVATVPEPSTWVMGAVGIACAGGILLRRMRIT